MVTFYEKVHWNCKWSFEFWVFKLTRVHLCCSFLLTLFPCSTMGSLPWDAVLQELLQRGTFPWVVLQECLQHGSHLQGTVHKEQTAPAWSLLHGPQLLAGCCSCSGSPWAAASFRTYPPAVAWSPPWAAGEQRGCLHGPLLQCLEHLFPFLLHLHWCLQSFLSCFLIPLSHSCCRAFLPFIKHVITEVLPASLMGSALASDGLLLELVGTVSYPTWGSSRSLLT